MGDGHPEALSQSHSDAGIRSHLIAVHTHTTSLSLGLDKKKLKRAFGWFLLVIAVVMLVKAWG